MAIEIIDHKDSWPQEFADIASQIRAVLGELALRIDHIGSTSVPGLAAKDVIDLQITVAELDDPRLVGSLESIGYTRHPNVTGDHRPPGAIGPDSDWEKRFFRPPPAQRRTNTHVRVQGRPNQRYPLLFRDFLRAHPDYAEAYARLKRCLVGNLADLETYADVKDPAVDLIYFAAENWAEKTHWRLD